MRTSKCVVILVAVALAGIATVGQAQPAPFSPRQSSNTQSASCLVRIAVDPAVLPLNGETVDSLVHSPAVLLKAGRDVLSLNTPEDFNRLMKPQDPERSLITIRWLNTSSAAMSPAAGLPRQGRDYGNKGHDEEMMRQLEQIYGPAQAQQMMASPNEEKKGGVKESGPGTPGMGAGAGGGMSGMGTSSGASRAQEQPAEVRRLPGSPQGQPGIPRVPGESDVAYRTRLAQVRAQQAVLEATKARGTRSMNGGMMGGYGGMGGMGFYVAPGSPQQGEGMQQSATIELQVNLPDTVPPRADEFLRAVVKNLQYSLSRASASYQTELDNALVAARMWHEAQQSDLDGTAGDVARVRQQLQASVDLSQLTPQTPLAAAVDILRKSVEPPLNIMVLWTDVKYQSSIEPTTPINIDGMPKMRLGTALDLLVKGLTRGSPLMWRIKDDAVVIGTPATLGRSPEGAGQSTGDAEAVNLVGQRSELTRRAQVLELDLAGLDARQAAIGAQTAGVRQRVNERLAQDPVIRELEKLSQIYSSASTEEKEKAIRAKIELANRREELSKQAGGGQLEESNKELSRMAIDKAEKEAQLKIVRKQLDEVQKQLVRALAFDPEAARLRMARESLDIAARRVAELQMRISNLQPPIVTVLGAN